MGVSCRVRMRPIWMHSLEWRHQDENGPSQGQENGQHGPIAGRQRPGVRICAHTVRKYGPRDGVHSTDQVQIGSHPVVSDRANVSEKRSEAIQKCGGTNHHE